MGEDRALGYAGFGRDFGNWMFLMRWTMQQS
jgi:hypothetical protein